MQLKIYLTNKCKKNKSCSIKLKKSSTLRPQSLPLINKRQKDSSFCQHKTWIKITNSKPSHLQTTTYLSHDRESKTIKISINEINLKSKSYKKERF